MDIKQSAVQSLPYYGRLTASEKELVDKNAVIRTYRKGSCLLGSGEECLGQLLILDGALRVYILSEEGREITLFRMYPGDTGVLSASCVISQITFDVQIEAEEDARVLVLNSGAFKTLTDQNIYARCYMYELLTERFSSVMWTMQEILFKGYDRRLASFLVGEYERTGSPELRMTHEQIASHTSSAREVVARMLKRFSADGLVDVKRGLVTLRNVDALRSMI